MANIHSILAQMTSIFRKALVVRCACAHTHTHQQKIPLMKEVIFVNSPLLQQISNSLGAFGAAVGESGQMTSVP